MIKSKTKLFAVALPAILALAINAHAADKVGLVSAAKGQTQMRADGADWQSLNLKAPVYAGATVRTGDKGRLKILFEDDSVLTLGPNSTMKIDQFVYNSRSNERKSKFSLFTGKLRAVVSRLFSRDKEDFVVESPTAVAGVRGTTFLMNVADKAKTQVFVIEGEVSVVNSMEAIEREMILSQGLMSDILEGEPPSFPEPIPTDLLNDMLGDTDVSLPVTRKGEKVNDSQITRAEKSSLGGGSSGGGGEGGEGGGGLDNLDGGEGGGGDTNPPPIDQTPNIPDGFAEAEITINFPRGR